MFVDFEAIKGPIWQLASLSGDVRPLPSGVFTSPVSVDVVAAFLREYQDYSWFGAVERIVWDRRAGDDLFRLALARGKQRFEILIQQSKYDRQELGAMLEEIRFGCGLGSGLGPRSGLAASRMSSAFFTSR